jgi:uncharacterized membrane protein
MKKALNNIIKNNYLFFIIAFFVSIFSFYFLNKIVIDNYILNDFVGGWDGSSHFAIAKYYSESIFPSVWGWVPNWFMGMPFPQFYPPLFYYLLAVISRLSSIPFISIFKLVALSLIAIIPVLLSLLYYVRVKKSKLQAFCVLVLSILLMSLKTNFAIVATSVYGVLNTGLVTQPLAIIFLIIWLTFFTEIDKGPINRYIAGFLLVMIFLSNAHVVITTAFLFTFFFINKLFLSKKNELGRWHILKIFGLYFLSGGLPLIVASFWYIPMINYYDYFSGMSISTAHTLGNINDLFISHYYLIIFLVLSFVFSFKKNTLVKIISATTILFAIFLYIKIETIFPNLPFHPDRWIGIMYSFLPILIVFVFSEAYYRISINKKLLHIIISLIAIFTIAQILPTIFFTQSNLLRGIYTDGITENIGDVINYFKDKKGLVLTESYSPRESPANLILDTEIGLQENKALTFILRESSISSPILTAIRNTFSKSPECWHSIKCHLSNDFDYHGQPIDKHIKTARDLGVEYFLIRTRAIKDELDTSRLVKKVKDFGNWAIYQTTTSPANISIPEREPVLVFSELNVHSWSQKTYDYMSLVEQINIKRHRTDFTFAYADKPNIDDNTDLYKFNYLLLQDYKYTDFEKAYKKLKSYAEEKNIIAVRDNNILFNAIEDISKTSDRILIVDKGKIINQGNEYDYLVKLMDNFVKKTQISKNTKVSLQDNRNHLDIHLINSDAEKVIPILLKQSHFPAWKELNGSKIYLSSPTYSLLFMNKSTSIYFSTPKIVIVAHVISLLGIILSTILFIWTTIKNIQNNEDNTI